MGKYNPTYKINLITTFNRSYSGVDPKLANSLRSVLRSSAFKDVFGKAVIDKIVERTLAGVDRFDQPFAPYSQSYMKSDIFKIYKKTSHVNLELTGEMLSSLKSVDTMNSIVIELIGDNNQAKADGHIHGLGKNKVRRDFLGLPDKELESIMKETVNKFKSEAFSILTGSFQNQHITDAFAQIGRQPEAAFGVDVNLVLAGVASEQ